MSQTTSQHSSSDGFRIAAVQMVSTPVIDENLQTVRRLMSQAAWQGAQLVLLPE